MKRKWYRIVDHGKNIQRYLKLTPQEAKEFGEYRNLTVTQDSPPNKEGTQ